MENAVNFNIDSSTPLPVVDDIVNQTLDKIYEYLSKKSKEDRDSDNSAKNYYNKSLANQASEKNDRSNQIRASMSNDRAVQKALSGISGNQKKNMASEANNRAIDKALSGKQNRDGLDAIKELKDTMKSCFDTLKGALLGVLNDTLKTQTQYAKLMRQNFLTKEEKDKSQIMANAAQGQVQDLLGFKLDKSEIVEYYNALQAGGHDLEAMGEEQRAKYAALRKSGLDDAEAYKYAMEASTAAVKQITTAAADPRTRQLIKHQLATVSESERATIGVDKVLSQIAQSSADTARYAGGAITDWEKAAQMAANNRKAANGMTEEVDGALLAIQGGVQAVGSEGQRLVEQANKYSTEQLRALASSDDEATRQMANQLLTIKNMQANGQSIGTNVRTTNQNEQAIGDNASNGKVNFEIQKLFGAVDNNLFGGAIGKFSNRLDEMFGDSADMGRLVSTGFKFVSALLKVISLNTSSMAKWILSGLGAAGAVIAIVANWDKIKPKLGEIFESIKPLIEKVIQNLPGFIKDVITGIGNLLPKIWEGIKNAFSSFFSDGGLLGKAGSSLSGAISGLKDKLSNTDNSSLRELKSNMSKIDMSSSKTAASNLAGSVRSTVSKIDMSSLGDSLKKAAPMFKGFFDGIGSAIADAVPGIRDIILKVTEVIGKLIDIVAPAVPAIVHVIQTVADAIVPAIGAIKEMGISIVDSVKEVTLSLINGIKEIVITTVGSIKEVLITLVEPITLIAEAINVLSKAIAPHMPTIVNILEFAIKSLLPNLLKLLGKVVDTILPPILDITKKIVESFLPPIVETFNKLVDVILPPISEVLRLVSETINKIVNLIVDTITPPLLAVSNLITNVLSTLDDIVSFINDIVNTFHGLFNFFISKIPDLIGWVSGILDWATKDIFPIIKKGFELVFSVVKALKDSLIAIITVALSPAMTVFNIISAGISQLKSFIVGKWGDGWDSSKELTSRFDSKISAIKAMGHGDTAESKAAYKTLMDFLKSKDNGKELSDEDQITAWQLYKTYESMLSNNKSAGEIALGEAVDSWEKVGNIFGELTSSVATAIDNGGPKKNEATVEEVKQYLSGQRGNITAENVLPQNAGSLLETITECVKKTSDATLKIHDFLTELTAYAGGASSTHGPGLVGEAGREAILPLDKPAWLKKLVSKMSLGDRRQLINAASGEVGSTAADVAMAFARDQIGKPYSVFKDGYVCNTLVHAAYKKAGVLNGWNLNYHNVRKWWTDEPRLYKVPLSEAKPGMIGFSNMNKKTGNPQHMGIITENGKWINASGSAVNGDYGKNFRATLSSKGVVEALMNKKSMVGAGYLDGMFNFTDKNYTPSGPLGSPDGITPTQAEQATSQGAITSQSKELTPEEYSQLYSNLAEGADIIATGVEQKTNTQLEVLQTLSKNAINEVIASTNGQVRYDVSNSKSAKKISDSNSQRDEIVLAMKDVVRYLRDMASFVKKPTGASAPARLPHA